MSETAPAPHPASRQLLVAFAKLPDSATRTKLWIKHGVKEIEQVGQNALILVEAPLGTGPSELERIKQAIAAESGIRYAEPNLMMKTFSAPDSAQ